MDKLLKLLNDNARLTTEQMAVMLNMTEAEVEGLSLMSGGHDLMVTVNGRSFKDVAMFVAKRLSPLPGVLGTATHFVLKKYKERGVLFTDEEKDERGGV